MQVTVRAVEEYNDKGFLIYAENFPGAYVRGRTRERALKKFEREIKDYLLWEKGSLPEEPEVWVDVCMSVPTGLTVEDADSEVIFDSERESFSPGEYQRQKQLVLKSAADFYEMYQSVPDKTSSALPLRETFYGSAPRTAEEMYRHTKNVTAYYFGEIGICAENEPDIYTCREAGFQAAEERMDYLDNRIYEGRGGELWSLKKVMRRFLWHDRIHAKAMLRMAEETFGRNKIKNPYCFSKRE